jgi:hypothetical protein
MQATFRYLRTIDQYFRKCYWVFQAQLKLYLTFKDLKLMIGRYLDNDYFNFQLQ